MTKEVYNYPAMKKIECMIIGAQKAGTTSLANYLGEHPNLRNSLGMEFTYFMDTAAQEKGLASFMKLNYPGETRSDEHLIAKMSNLYCSREGLARLKEHNPECRLAMIVRDPVKRAYSAYVMACYDGWLKYDEKFLDSLLDRDPDDELYQLFIGYGHYVEKLKVVFEIFSRDQVDIFRFEDLKKDPQKICDKLFPKIGVAPYTLGHKDRIHNPTYRARVEMFAHWIHELRRSDLMVKRFLRRALPYAWYLRMGKFLQDLNRSGSTYPPIPQELRERWGRYYRPYDQELATMTGLDLGQWTSMNASEATVFTGTDQ